MSRGITVAIVNTDEGQIVSLNAFKTSKNEVFFPATYKGKPITRIGCRSYYQDPKVVNIDLVNQTSVMIPGHWVVNDARFDIPSHVEIIHIPRYVEEITPYFFFSNPNVKVVIDQRNPKEYYLERQIEVARKTLLRYHNT